MDRIELIFFVTLLFIASCTKEADNRPITDNGVRFEIARLASTKGKDIEALEFATLGRTIRVGLSGLKGASGLTISDFSKNSTSGYFESATEYKWPTNDSEVSYWAYYPKNDASGESYGSSFAENNTKTPLEISNLTINSNISKQKDFIVAYGTGKNSLYGKTAAPLAFTHQLSKLTIEAKSTSTDYKFEVKGVRIENLKMSASKFVFPSDTVSYGAFTLASTKSNCAAELSNAITLGSTYQNIMGSDEAAYILPQTITTWQPATDSTNTGKATIVSVKLKITKKSDNTLVYPLTSGSYAYASIPISSSTTNFTAGSHYKLSLDFTEGAGYVSPDYQKGSNDPYSPGKLILDDVEEGGEGYTIEMIPWETVGASRPAYEDSFYEFLIDIPQITRQGVSDQAITVVSTKNLGATVVENKVSWSVEYSADNGVTWSEQAPDGLSIMRDETSGNAIVNVASTISSDITWDAPKGSSSSYYNLSNQTDGGATIENTANCYIINGPGYYEIPLVYGNAIGGVAGAGNSNTSAYNNATFVNSAGVAISSPYICTMQSGALSASVVWQDEEDLIIIDGIEEVGNNAFLKFHTGTINPGNAVLAAKVNGAIVWSWHIWAINYTSSQDVQLTNSTFMAYPLGWYNDVSYQEHSWKVRFIQDNGDTVEKTLIQEGHIGAAGGSCTYYQWGRKDPSPGWNNYNSDYTVKPIYPASGWRYLGTASITKKVAIANPGVFYTKVTEFSNDGLMWNNNGNKTIYDPSPVGYRVPSIEKFTNATANSSLSATPIGIYLGGSSLFLPFAGHRRPAAKQVATNGYYWCNSVGQTFSISRAKNGSIVQQSGTLAANYGGTIVAIRE